ncbi:MAG: NAD-binding protein [Cyanobacteria bacterium P01_H01_bin.21]
MYFIVIGAEKEGQHFVNLTVEGNHEVTLIDPSEEKARQILKENNVRVLVGNIAEDGILEEAEIERADAVIAATYDDAQNLMAMVLAKEQGVDTLISLVNYKIHDNIFEKLGVNVVSEPARVVAHQLYDCLG